MLKNYIKIAFRNLKKNKFYSFVNIFGITIGITSAILTTVWVLDELDYDKFYSDQERVYLIESQVGGVNKKSFWQRTPDPLGEVIMEDFPEIESVVKLDGDFGVSLTVENESFVGENFFYASPNIIDLFNIELLFGNATTAFSDPNSIILTEENSQKLFGTNNSIGEKILVKGGFEMIVSGVIKSSNRNTHRPIEYLVPYKFLEIHNKTSDDWGRFDFYTYIKVKPNISIDHLKAKLYNYLQKHREEAVEKLFLRKVEGIHLYAPYGLGDINKVILIGIVGLVVLFIGCINYINLSTAQAAKRYKEIGVRTTIGARKKDLTIQFLFESAVIIVSSFLLSMVLLQILLNPFNSFADKNFVYTDFFTFEKLALILAIISLVTIISAIYPAIYLSRYNPFSILKNSANSFFNELRIRKSLTFVHFFVTVIFLVTILFISKQMDFIQNKDLGFDSEQILWINTQYLGKDIQTFKNKIEEKSQVIGSSVVSSLPANMGNYTWLNTWEGSNEEESVLFNIMAIDNNFLQLMNIEHEKGENFRPSKGKKGGIIVNEEAIKKTGITNPLGKYINIHGYQTEIIGVVKNFHNKSLHEEITPIIMHHSPGKRGQYLLVKIAPTDVSKTLKAIENIYLEYNSKAPFVYSFLDDDIDKLYKNEQKFQMIFSYLTVLIIIIASIGLLALTTYSAERKRKEIGIRKVLGASINNLTLLITKEFIVIVIAAILFAFPITYFLVDYWLQSFVYKIEIDFSTFLYGGSFILLLTLITLGTQVVKAAVANPVESLRDE